MKLYLIAHERSLSGTWNSPKEAVKQYYHSEIRRGEIDIDEKVREMLTPGCDYPYFVILEPGKKFDMDR